jgi:hypothetical protein
MFVLSSFLCDLGVKAKLCSFCYCLITWVKVFSILTDFRFFGKDPDSSRDLCKFDEVFFQGVKYAFLTKKWKILKESWLFKSCWFLFQSPIRKSKFSLGTANICCRAKLVKWILTLLSLFIRSPSINMGKNVFFWTNTEFFFTIKCWSYYVTCEGRKANWNCYGVWVCIYRDYYTDISQMNGRLKQKSTGLEQSGSLQNFSFLCQKCILHPLKKKLIKFTQI